MIKVLIVEDEIPAQVNIKKLIEKCCDDSRIVMTLTSVRSTVKWLEENPQGADVIFLDVELSDGVCFDIFDKVEVKAQVIITTAYDNYAINAFRVNTLDYLLKPITESDMRRAWERCKERISQQSTPNIETLVDMVTKAGAPKDREDKSTYAVIRNGSRRLLDYSLDTVQEMLDPKIFFRVSRSYIVSINYIENISKHLGTRLKLHLTPHTEEDVIVSRSRTSDFLEWLDNN